MFLKVFCDIIENTIYQLFYLFRQGLFWNSERDQIVYGGYFISINCELCTLFPKVINKAFEVILLHVDAGLNAKSSKLVFRSV